MLNRGTVFSFVFIVFLVSCMINAEPAIFVASAAAVDSFQLPTDVNADGVVNILDLFIVAMAWNSYPGHPRWNSQVDFNNDNMVDILDIVEAVKDFGIKWVHFAFDEANDLNAWTVVSGTWNILNGSLEASSSAEGLIYVKGMEFRNCTLRARVKIAADSPAAEIAFCVDFVDSNNFYGAGLGCWDHKVSISKMINQVSEELVFGGNDTELVKNVWYNVTVEIAVGSIKLYLNNILELDTNDSTFTGGTFGIRIWNSHVLIDDIAVLGLATMPTQFQPSIKTRFYASSWSFGEYSAETIARTFGMSQSWWVEASAAGNYARKMEQVHKINPQYKSLVYRNVKDIYDYWKDEWQLAYDNGWLLKDRNSQLIRSSIWPENYAVDVGNPDYQKWVAAKIKSWLEQYPFFDGVFADNGLAALTSEFQWDSSARAINPRTGRYWTDQEVRTAYIQLHKEIKNAIGFKLLCCNGIWTGARFYDHFAAYNEILSSSPLDGIMSEGTWNDYGTNWYSEQEWLESLRLCAWIQDEFLKGHPNKCFTAVCISTETLPADCKDREQMALFGFASMLLGAETSQNYMYLGGNLNEYSSLLGFMQSLQDVDVGYPENDYYLIAETHVYARDFSKAMILVNPGSNSYTVNLHETFRTLDNKTVTEVTMEPHTGTILLK
jgi:hypothetical protein